MGHVTVEVNGRRYKMSCDGGMEPRVGELATYIDGLVQDIKGGHKHVQEERVYLMAAIMIADQLFEVRDEMQTILAQICNLRAFQTADSQATYLPANDIARIVDASSRRLRALEERFARTGS